MADFKLLVDTNVVIALEDHQPVQASLAELVRLCNEYSIGLFVDGANFDDVERDRDKQRREITLSKLQKFQKLRNIPLLDENRLVERYGAINSDNDRSDVRLLATLDSKAVDFLITADIRLHKRAERASLGAGVLTIEEALSWLKQSFVTKSVTLPHIVERKAYEIPQTDAIFASLRLDYAPFDKWFDKCRREHRDCWILEVENAIAGIVIRKDETRIEAQTHHAGTKILKICTFKVREEFQGEKFGELLLKQILWYAQQNSYDLAYITAFPKHAFLIELLKYYGFQETRTLENGELVLEKPFLNGPLADLSQPPYDFDRLNYPRFHDGAAVAKFCVPIQADYHRRLFPEIAFGQELPLFPTEKFGPILSRGQSRLPGNTIRKVYLCRAKTNRICAGDLLFFYMSKDERLAASQSLTTVSVAEQVITVTNTDDLIRLTAKRSVFSASEMHDMDTSPSNPVKVIDFLLVGHIQPPIGLSTLVTSGAFSRHPPQSIAQLPEERYQALKPLIQLGFEI
jgi:GNAT superfamily N-acetyltransferase/predicted nucleic acid-binding protein